MPAGRQKARSINEGFGKEVSGLLENSNYHTVELIKDIHGKERFVSGRKR